MNNDDGRLSLSARLDIAVKILRDMSGQTALSATIDEAADLARRWEESKPVRVVADDTGNHIDLEAWLKSYPQPGLYRIVPDMGEG